MKEIPLTQGKIALVDDADYEWLSQWKWHFTPSYKNAGAGYAKRSDRSAMHRIILNAPKDKEVDHINRNSLDNRRENLRLVTLAQNRRNRSKHKLTKSQFKGIVWDKQQNRWVARIKLNRKFIVLGRFATEIDAAHAYDEGARLYHGDFASTNF